MRTTRQFPPKALFVSGATVAGPFATRTLNGSERVLTPVLKRVVQKHTPRLKLLDQPDLLVLGCCGWIVERLSPLDDWEDPKEAVAAT